jgi:serine protease
MKLRLPAIALFVGLAISAVPMRSIASSQVAIQSKNDLVTELIVERLPGRTSLGAMSLIENEFELNATVESKIVDRLEVLQLDQPITRTEANSLVQKLVDSGKVASAEINEKRYVVAAPNDPDYGSQWYLKDFASNDKGIGIEAAWDHTVGSTDVVIAVIDTGGTSHPDMVGRFVQGYDFFADDGDPTDEGDGYSPGQCPGISGGGSSSWHGTKVAGIIGANVNNALGIGGINQLSFIQHIRILGQCGGTTSDEIRAIRWAAGLPVDGVPLNSTPARVLNLSLGGEGPCSPSEQDAINAAVATGAIVVVAAGNGGNDLIGDDLDVVTNSPANCDNVITVTATTESGQRASFSNYGSKVTIAAPGVAIRTTTVNGYSYSSGTSFSTPILSGIISLMLSVNPTLEYGQVVALFGQPGVANPFPTLSPPTITSACSSNINDTYYCGLGIIDAAHAVHAALSIAPEVFSPMQPVRIADTRPSGLVSADNSLVLDLKGTFGLPNAGLGAVVLNVTATGATQGGYVTVWPCADNKPVASSVNYAAGEDIPNTVIASPDAYGQLCLDSSTPVNLIVDMSGWFISGDELNTFTPQRAFDLRTTGLVVTPNTPYAFQMTGNFGIPPSGASSVVLNVTATGATESGYITVWPCDQPQPNTSNLNYLPYQDIPNAVIATVDTNGQVCFASSSPTFLIADISGWFAQSSNLNVITPQRLLDTRPAQRVSAQPTYVLDLSATSPVSTGTATAVVLNVTATRATGSGFATVWPCDESQPPTSNLNFDANEDIPNLVITKVSANNTICFSASTPVHLIADLMGWFAP